MRNKFSINPDGFNVNGIQFEGFKVINRSELHFIIEKTKLIENERKALWNFIYLNKKTVSNFNLIVLLLPQLEHLLRKLYAISDYRSHLNTTADNELKINVINNFYQTAKIDEFYLTIDDLLKPRNVSANKNQEINPLINLLNNDRLVYFIFELFMYMDGPRLRDHISHGDLDQISIPDSLFEFLLFVCINLASIDVIKNEDYKDKLKNFIKSSEKICLDYEPRFHPVSSLQHKIFCLIVENENFDAKVETEDLLANGIFLDLRDQLLSLIKAQFKFYSGKAELFLGELRSKWKFSSLYELVYRYENQKFKSNELQLIGILGNLTKQLGQLMSKLSNKNNEINKQASMNDIRERQRNNYKSFILNLSIYRCFIQLTVWLLVLLFDSWIIRTNLKDIVLSDRIFDDSLYDKNYEAIIKQLKQYLQLLQNLNSKCEENKWIECLKLIDQNKEKISRILNFI